MDVVKNDKEYKLDVNQIAQAQMNVSEGVKAADYAKEAMNFTIDAALRDVKADVDDDE